MQSGNEVVARHLHAQQFSGIAVKTVTVLRLPLQTSGVLRDELAAGELHIGAVARRIGAVAVAVVDGQGQLVAAGTPALCRIALLQDAQFIFAVFGNIAFRTTRHFRAAPDRQQGKIHILVVQFDAVILPRRRAEAVSAVIESAHLALYHLRRRLGRS